MFNGCTAKNKIEKNVTNVKIRFGGGSDVKTFAKTYVLFIF